MRVFCPQHKTGFFTPRRNPIRCENRGHVLGNFVFDSNAEASVETLWQYCCNCEHFCPVELDQRALETCPACARRISQLYLCDRCFTVSFESSTPSQTKNFSLTADGVPQPSCPGCLQEASGDLREHDCDELGAHFTTGLNSCPICLENLNAGPTFPSSVAQYLRKTKAANKLNVAFDYETGLFLSVDNGDFVLVRSGTKNGPSFVLPRSTRFASKADFYELYQDYYHCPNVNAGEVHVIQPALVERLGDGWKLQSTGVLEIVDTQPKTNAPTNNIPLDKEFPLRERSGLFSATLMEESSTTTKESPAAALKEAPVVTCIVCGSLVQTKYLFCWNCGQPTKAAAASKQATEAIGVSHRIIAYDDESTIHRDVGHIQPAMFSWALSEPSATPPTSSRLKLIAFIVIGLFAITVAVFLLKEPVSQLGRSADAQQVTPSLQSAAGIPPRAEPTVDATRDTKRQTNPTIDSAEEELRQLREKRIGVSSSDRLTMLQLLASKEEQYADDYRFPYERAKLAINALETRSHHDAFNALSVAAEKAIKTNKADEMLKGLEADSATDFHKLSHGHPEWSQVINALKRKDATLLTSN